jgi:SAM-dependent methyltransferase
MAGVVQRVADDKYEPGPEFHDCLLRKGFFTWLFGASASVLLAGHELLVDPNEQAIPSRDGALIGSATADFGRRNVDAVLLDAVEISRYKCALDIGCGDGSRLEALVRRSDDIDGVGLDASQSAIAAARRRDDGTLSGRLTFVQGDALQMDFDPALRMKVDVALMALMAHDLLPPVRAREVLMQWQSKLPNLQRLVVCETVRLPQSPASAATVEVPSSGYELLHSLMGIEVETDSTWREILESSGLVVSAAHPIDIPGSTLVYVCDVAR